MKSEASWQKIRRRQGSKIRSSTTTWITSMPANLMRSSSHRRVIKRPAKYPLALPITKKEAGEGVAVGVFISAEVPKTINWLRHQVWDSTITLTVPRRLTKMRWIVLAASTIVVPTFYSPQISLAKRPKFARLPSTTTVFAIWIRGETIFSYSSLQIGRPMVEEVSISLMTRGDWLTIRTRSFPKAIKPPRRSLQLEIPFVRAVTKSASRRTQCSQELQASHLWWDQSRKLLLREWAWTRRDKRIRVGVAALTCKTSLP